MALAVVGTQVSRYTNTAAITTFDTAPAFTPGVHSLMIACLSWSTNTTRTVSTVQTTSATNRYTFAQVAGTVSSRANISGHEIWVSDSGATPPTDTITVTMSGQCTGFDATIIEVTGADMTGAATAAIAATPTPTTAATDGSSLTTPSITLAAASNAANRPLSIISVDIDNAAITQRANWTELDELAYSTPVHRLHAQWRSDAFETTANATFTSTIVGVWYMSAIEIKAAIATGSPVGFIPI